MIYLAQKKTFMLKVFGDSADREEITSDPHVASKSQIVEPDQVALCSSFGAAVPQFLYERRFSLLLLSALNSRNKSILIIHSQARKMGADFGVDFALALSSSALVVSPSAVAVAPQPGRPPPPRGDASESVEWAISVSESQFSLCPTTAAGRETVRSGESTHAVCACL